MDFQPNLEDNSYLIITLNKSSASVVLPKTVQLAVYACAAPFVRLTKAQVEQGKNSNQFIYSLKYFF
jgi:hypothetical protein